MPFCQKKRQRQREPYTGFLSANTAVNSTNEGTFSRKLDLSQSKHPSKKKEGSREAGTFRERFS